MTQPESELNNFSVFIAQTVNETLGQEGGSGFREAAFTREIMDYLSTANETGNVRVCTAIRRNKLGNRQYQINGYGLWDNYETLDIFIAHYQGDGSLYTLPKAGVISDLNLALRYVEHLEKDNFDDLEESSVEREFYDNYLLFKDKLQQIRVILLTDGLVKRDIETTPTQVGGQTITTEIWDLERIFQVWSSQRKREPINFNIREKYGYSIRCLQIDQPAENYTAYICIVPAALLADLYRDYKSRVLEQNVRVYLQNVGKINKEIRKTILEAPGMFMAYNNGISATATSISFDRDERSGNDVIGLIKDLQIVNGAQTTSSLYYARKKDSASLDGIHVQMKITLIPDNRKMERVVSAISKYANSQNKISETDLTSNLPFNIRMEEISRTTWATPLTGNRQTRWYFERVKGQYREEINREHRESAKNAFQERNPSEQVIRKDELARFRHSWHQKPYWVARGSQKNYMHFIEEAKNIEPTRQYFQHTVGIAILFKEAERLYGRKPYAMGDLRYLVVPYSIAWLSHHTNERLDLGRIWKQQHLSQPLEKMLETVLRAINDFLQRKKPNEYALVGEWAKKEECWENISNISARSMGVDLRSIKKLLADADDSETNAIEDAAQIRSVTIEQWEAIENFGKHGGRLSPLEQGAVHNIISRMKKQQPLTEQLIVHGATAFNTYENQRKKKR